MRRIIVLCGSQIRVMELIQGAQSPLFGRLSGQWYLQPLPFSALTAFFPTWPVEERIAVSALVGGLPAYRRLLAAGDISVDREYEDEGQNHYFDAFV